MKQSSLSSSLSETLTPSTLTSITQLFESDDCLANLQKTFEDENAINNENNNENHSKNNNNRDSLPLQPLIVLKKEQDMGENKNNTLFSSNGWQGGLTTIVTPDDNCLPKMISDANAVAMITGSLRRSSRKRRATKRDESEDNEEVDKTYDPDNDGDNNKAKRAKKMGNNKNNKVNKTGGSKKRRRHGGIVEERLNTEDQERLKVRRLRNKEAAARCRQRRVDQTNTLMEEVELWESKKRMLENEIRILRAEKDELEYVLNSHQCQDQLKEEEEEKVDEGRENEAEDLSNNRMQRPNALNIKSAQVEGVSIDTPSNVLVSFDSIVTPVVSCNNVVKTSGNVSTCDFSPVDFVAL